MVKTCLTVSWLTLMSSFSSNAIADESWIGKRVLPKNQSVTIRHSVPNESSSQDLSRVQSISYIVIEENNGFVATMHEKRKGWMKKTDVVLVSDAEKYFSEVIERTPLDANAFTLRAAARKLRGDLEKALMDYCEAIRLDPKSAPYWHNRGTLYLGVGQFEKALKDFDEALHLEPENLTILCSHAVAVHKKGDLQTAIKEFDSVIKKDPRFLKAYNGRGNVRFAQRDMDKAKDDFDEAIRLDPTDGRVYYNRSNVWKFKKQYEKAVADLEAAIRNEPDFVPAYSNLALLLSACPVDKLRDGKKAIRLAKQACEITNYSNPLMFNALAAAFAEDGQFDEAVSWQQKAMEHKAFPPSLRATVQKLVEQYSQKRPLRIEE